MNKKLINKLYQKWESVEKRPSKGAALDRDCNPCAQSVVVMDALSMGKFDFKAFSSGLFSGRVFETGDAYPESLDTFAAKTLGTSTIHAILLRRFNDFSSENPGIVLKEPWLVLGANWRKVLQFWRWVDSLTPQELKSRLILLRDYTNYGRFPKERKVLEDKLREKVEAIDVITADLYYYKDAFGKETKPSSIQELASGEHSHLRAYNGLQKEDGSYSPGFLSWMASWDFTISNGFSSIGFHEVKNILAQVTWEIQTLSPSDSFSDLYFCKSLGYNPFKSLFTESEILFRSFRKGVRGSVDLVRRKASNRGVYSTRIEPEVKVSVEDLKRGSKSLLEELLERKGDSRSLIVGLPKTGTDTSLEEFVSDLLKEVDKNQGVSIRPVSQSLKEMDEHFLWQITDVFTSGLPSQERPMAGLNEVRVRKFNTPRGYQ